MPHALPKRDTPASPEDTLWWPRIARGGMAMERACALWLHRATVWPSVCFFFRCISQLGDGFIWALTFPCLALWGGPHALPCMLRLAGMTVANLMVYKVLKQSTSRQRPFKTCPGIRLCARALDEYSFPSGHTLHAVAFSIMLSIYYPVLTWPLAVFAVLVALSRVILGLHYPSDVLMGAGIGAISAWAFQNLV